MRKALLPTLLFTLTFLPTLSYSQLVSSVADGAVNDPSIWDCNCVPAAAATLQIDHVVTHTTGGSFENITVRNGGHFIKTRSGRLTVNKDLVINAGGEFSNNTRIDVFGDYEIAGIHSGNRPVWLRGTDTEIRGVVGGTITNHREIYISDGNKVIPAGSVINKQVGATILAGIEVVNLGEYNAESLKGGPGSKWTQDEFSLLGIGGDVAINIELSASAKGNVVSYNRTGSSTQVLAVPVGEEYFDLRLAGSSLGSKKQLQGSLLIAGDMTIESCVLDVRKSGIDHDLQITGNWSNTSGAFKARLGEVRFLPDAPVTIDCSGTEKFNDLIIDGASTVELLTDIAVLGELEVLSIFDAGMTGRVVEFAGSLNVTGSLLTGNSNYIASGSKPQFVNGVLLFNELTVAKSSDALRLASGTTSIAGTLRLTSGSLNANGRLVMLSDENGDSRIAEITGGTINGDVTVQRYIDSGATNWRFLTAPAAANTLADWKDDLITSGFPGSHYPGFSFTNIYSHDETAPGTLDDGFIPAADISDPLEKGVGYWVWSGDNSAGTQPFTIDVDGDVYTGNVQLPVSYTGHGSADDDGWNMVGNPYVSVIDWDSPEWVKVNMNNSVSIWNPDLQQFSTYIDGVSVNGGSRYIASSQAFWVHANGPSPRLVIKEGVKTDMVAGFKSASPSDVLRLKVSGQGYSDETVMRMDPAATNDFDQGLDALEMISLNADAPNVYTQTGDGMDVQVNAFPKFQADTSMYVSIEVGVSGNYVLSVEEVANGFSASCMILEDLETNVTSTLTVGSTISFFADPNNNGQRFLLYFSAPLTAETVSASCAGANDGAILVIPGGQGPWDMNVSDISGHPIASAEQVNGAHVFDQLSAGDHQVTIVGQAPCGPLTVTVTIAEPAAIEIEASVTNTTCANDQDGSISLTVTGGQAPYQFLWNDGTATANLGNVGVGNYSVQVTDDAQCAVQQDAQIKAEHQVQAMFHAPENAAAGETVELLDLSIGADQVIWDMGDGSAPFISNAPSYTYAQPGIYTISQNAVTAGCGNTHQRHITIEGHVGVNDVAAIPGVELLLQNDVLYLSNLSGGAMELTVQVDDVLGRTILPAAASTFGEGITPIRLADSPTALIMITVTDERNGERMTSRIVR